MRRILFSLLRVTVAIGAIIFVVWWIGIRMPGKNVLQAAPLSPPEIALRAELQADVQKLAGDIGERNIPRYPALNAAAEFIEKSFTDAGLRSRRDTYEVRARACHNIEVELPGASQEIVLIGAHYDSVFGAPGANDNGTGVAGMLALARRFAGKTPQKTLRFVAFVNEEPPYFQTFEMGSLVYAARCKARGDRIQAMISLETIGYFSDAPHSQVYPSPGLGVFYPRTANFIGFVANVGSRRLLKRALKSFRAEEKLPSEGAAVPAFIPGVGWSDHWAFWQNGYPAIMVTDTALFRYRHYHQPTDTPDKIDYDRFTLVVSGMQNVITDLAGTTR
jgi:Zn-dependent M28 family amino/carboxypeptidase